MTLEHMQGCSLRSSACNGAFLRLQYNAPATGCRSALSSRLVASYSRSMFIAQQPRSRTTQGRCPWPWSPFQLRDHWMAWKPKPERTWSALSRTLRSWCSGRLAGPRHSGSNFAWPLVLIWPAQQGQHFTSALSRSVDHGVTVDSLIFHAATRI